MIYLRSMLFNVLMIILTVFFALVTLIMYPLPFSWRYTWTHWYAIVIIKLAQYICGIRYEIIGLENIPKRSAIVMSNHQSMWETCALNMLLPTQTWVSKKELTRVPFFGWALLIMEPIIIDRNDRSSAMEQLLTKGAKQLDNGRWVILYPQGTRISAGQYKAFSKGGSILAENTSAPIVPIAHNAGDCWSRKALLKKPGKITLIIGPAIETAGRIASDINAEAEAWVYEQLAKIQPTQVSND